MVHYKRHSDPGVEFSGDAEDLWCSLCAHRVISASFKPCCTQILCLQPSQNAPKLETSVFRRYTLNSRGFKQTDYACTTSRCAPMQD